jgi:hypothetical protein
MIVFELTNAMFYFSFLVNELVFRLRRYISVTDDIGGTNVVA